MKFFSKCPQCNQPTLRTQLVRLYINEPGTSTENKDELVDISPCVSFQLNLFLYDFRLND